MNESTDGYLDLFGDELGEVKEKSNTGKEPFSLPIPKKLLGTEIFDAARLPKAGIHWTENEEVPPPAYLASSTGICEQEYQPAISGDRRRKKMLKKSSRKERKPKALNVFSLACGMMLWTSLLAAKEPKDMSLGWDTSIKRAGQALEEGKLTEARSLIDEAKEAMPDHVLPHLLESRLGLAEEDMDMARLSAKLGLKKSKDWHSDLVIARVLAQTGDQKGAADAAMQSFVKGASIGYLPEIAQAQVSIGRDIEAQRVVAYGRRQGNVREEGFKQKSKNQKNGDE